MYCTPDTAVTLIALIQCQHGIVHRELVLAVYTVLTPRLCSELYGPCRCPDAVCRPLEEVYRRCETACDPFHLSKTLSLV